MVQPAESRKGLNLAFTFSENFCSTTCERVLREPKMSAVMVIVEEVRQTLRRGRKQESVRLFVGTCFSQLLYNPKCVGISRHIEMQDLPPVVAR